MTDRIKDIFEDITKRNQEGYFIVHSIPGFNSVITDGQTLIYSNESGYDKLKILEMDKGEIFKFENEKFEASIQGLKFLEIFIYGDKTNFYISGNLDNLLFSKSWIYIIVYYNIIIQQKDYKWM